MKTILSEEQLKQGIRELAQKIQQHYDSRPLTIIGVMIGSISLVSDLIRLLDMPMRVELIQSKCCSRGTQRPGPLSVDPEMLSSDIHGRNVLLVDDIFDTGNTLWELIPQIDELGAASVRSAVLLQKHGRSRFDVRPDFVAFEIPDSFVVGYGLDYNDKYRNLPYIAVLEPEDFGKEPG
jgi:hypoxanthine phosphoribosyltransferase